MTDANHKSKYLGAGIRQQEKKNENGMVKELLQESNCYQIMIRRLIFCHHEMDSIYLRYNLVFIK